MKTIKIILTAVCAVATFVSCDKNDPKETVTAPHPMTITLDREDATTKTTITYDSEAGQYLRTWSEGDALSVMWIDEHEGSHNEKFVLTSGAGTTRGTFTCATSEIPTTGQMYCRVTYPYCDKSDISNWYLSIANQSGKFEDLGKYDVLYTNNLLFENGVRSTAGVYGFPIKSYTTIFRIPAGTKIFNVSDESQVNSASFHIGDVMNEFYVRRYSVSAVQEKGLVGGGALALKGGCLVNDAYLTIIIVSSQKNPNYTITFHCTESGKDYSYTISKGTAESPEYIYAGSLYNLGASNFTPTLDY